MMAAQETAVQTKASRWKRFLREVNAERKKVSWPDRKESTAYTGVVFISVVFAALLIYVIDLGFTGLLKLFMH